MVKYDTLHKGTCKPHKYDENAPILRCTFLRQYFGENYPTSPITLSKLYRNNLKKDQCQLKNVHHRFVSFIFGLVPTRNI